MPAPQYSDDMDHADELRYGSDRMADADHARAHAPSATKKAHDDDEKARTATVRTSLEAAQHWVDRAVARIDRTKQQPASELEHAERYLAECEDTLVHSSQRFDRKVLQRAALPVGPAIVNLARALREQELVQPIPLFEKHKAIRAMLMLPEVVTQRGHTKSSKSDDYFERQAFGPVLDIVRSEATIAYQRVRRMPLHDRAREDVVGLAAELIAAHLDHSIYLQRSYGGHDFQAAFKTKIHQTSIALLDLHRWVAGRTNNSVMIWESRRVIDKIDVLRAAVGFDSIMNVKTAAQPQSEVESKDNEESDVQGAHEKVQQRLATALSGIKLGADKFFALANLKSPPATPPWWESLAKGTLVAMVSNLAGPLGAALANKMVSSGLSNAMESYVSGSITDTVPALADGIAGLAVAEAMKSENQLSRDALAVAHTAILTQHRIASAIDETISRRKANKSISIHQIEELAASLRDEAGNLGAMLDITFRTCAHEHASLLAKSQLGTAATRRGEVSRMSGYFGKDKHLVMPSFGKAGTLGVMRMTVEVFLSGQDLMHEIEHAEINGLNDDMAIAVMESAGYDLKNLRIPLEVVFRLPNFAIGRLAVDENMSLRDSIWRPGRDMQSAKNASVYANAEDVWGMFVTASSVPKSAVSIRKGG